MASRTITQLVSDLSGDDIDEGKGETIAFSYRGASYSIDLTDKEVAGFDKAIEVYTAHATKTAGRRSSRRGGAGRGDYDAKEVRAWARAQGLAVPDRGRIPADVVEQFKSAN